MTELERAQHVVFNIARYVPKVEDSSRWLWLYPSDGMPREAAREIVEEYNNQLAQELGDDHVKENPYFIVKVTINEVIERAED